MKKPKHHHGDLREALIKAGLELLEEGGPSSMTLRKCATRAGVSHAAPAHHFSGLISLQGAIIARGYRIFTEEMRNHRAKAAAEPRAQLLGICEGYLTFAAQHGALFRFIFQDFTEAQKQVDGKVLEEVNAESTAAYMELRSACAPFEPVNGHEQGTEVLVWSLVHGYAMLFSSNPRKETPAGPIPDFEQILPNFPLR